MFLPSILLEEVRGGLMGETMNKALCFNISFIYNIRRQIIMPGDRG